MCLDVVESYKRITRRRKGFQVFYVSKGRLYPLYATSSYITNCKRRTVPVNKWQRDGSERLLKSVCGEKYVTGFHIYPRFKSALRLHSSLSLKTQIREVHFREVVAEGLQGGPTHPAVVAKERRVGKVVKP